jgi:hypothetical protein
MSFGKLTVAVSSSASLSDPYPALANVNTGTYYINIKSKQQIGVLIIKTK